MPNSALRNEKETRQTIKDLAVKSNPAQQEPLSKALQIFEANLFWERCQAAYEKLSLNTEEMEQESAESELYINTLMDGIDEEY